MVLAVGTLSATAQAILFGLAILCFVACVLLVRVKQSRLGPLDFVALGLALFVFVFFWNALAAT